MAGTKEIRTKIASVKSTQKITKAMQMVATSKMRRAQDRMKLARPYAEQDPQRDRQPAAREPGLPASVHGRRAKRRTSASSSISTDRGLAGGLNANLFKQTLFLMKEWQEKGAGVSLAVIGSKGTAFFRRAEPADARQRLGPGRQAARQGPDRHASR